jgi:large subunit ribosomal protein L7/L12
MDKINKLVDELVNLTVVELLEFKKVLKEKYGLEETVIATVAPAAAEPEKVEEKTSFNVYLIAVEDGGNKLSAIKELNRITGLGLKASKDLTMNLPTLLKENATKAEAEEFKNTLAPFNAIVELR